jgi:formiminoglutamase
MNHLHHLRQAPPATRFEKRNDPHDRRLGEIVKTQVSDYASAEIVLLGCPQDEGVRRNRGRPGASEGPQAIREELYRLGGLDLSSLQLFDLGDTRTEGSLEEIHARHQRLVQQVIGDGKRLIVLGGGNDISYPDVAGLVSAEPDLLAFNIDAHFDVRADSPCNSGTPYRQLLEEGILKAGRFFQVAYQPYANSPVYLDYLTGLGVKSFSCSDVQAKGIDQTLDGLLQIESHAIFWGVDMDVVTAADAPGVSAVNPTGLHARELVRLAEIAGADRRSRLLEISEVNPVYDIDSRTSRLAAVIIWHFIRNYSALTPSPSPKLVEGSSLPPVWGKG